MSQVEYQSAGPEYLDALLSSKRAKNVFSLLLLLSVAVQIAGFVVVQFTDVLSPLYAKPVVVVTDEPGTQPADEAQTRPTTAPAAERREDAQQEAMLWADVLHWALPATRFVAFVSSVLLTLTLLMCVKLSLLDRLGGVAGFISSFYWSLLLLVVLTPWDQVLGGGFATGALSNFGQMVAQVKKIRGDWGPSQPDTGQLILHYGRFLAYPILAVLLWLVTQLKYARGYRVMARACHLMPPPVEEGPAPAEPAPPTDEPMP